MEKVNVNVIIEKQLLEKSKQQFIKKHNYMPGATPKTTDIIKEALHYYVK